MKKPLPELPVPALLCALDRNGVVTGATGCWQETLDRLPGDLIGRPLADIMPRVDGDGKRCRVIGEIEEARIVRDLRCRLLAADDAVRDMLCSAVAEYDEGGAFSGASILFTDISSQIKLEDSLLDRVEMLTHEIMELRDFQERMEEQGGQLADVAEEIAVARDNAEMAGRRVEESETRLRAIIATVADGILVIDDSLTIHMFNPAAERLFGYSLVECVGRKVDRLMVATNSEDTDFFLNSYMQSGDAAYNRYTSEVKGIRKDGKIFPMELTVSGMSLDKSNMFVAICRDISQRKQAEAELEALAKYDPLTGLANRNMFHERLNEALDGARRTDRSVGILFLDLDHFKDVNDTLGHPAGDELLKTVARRFENCIRATDTVARLGGDEFAIIATNLADRLDVLYLAERIIKSLDMPVPIDGQKVHTGTSIGITIYPDDAEDSERLLKNADLALYQAKSEGRNNYKCFYAQMNKDIQTRIKLENDLREAVENDSFVLYYQPQIDLRTGALTGLEALLRWQDEERGLVAPDKFLEIAERTRLILPITEWVLRTACKQVGAWQDAGLFSGRIAVNLSPADLRRPSLQQVVADILAEAGIEPQRLELEVTEGMIMGEIEVAVQTLQSIHSLGASIAIDDFGTGYSSLAYLRRFPVDVLKIDRSFVRDLAASTDDAAITQAIINIGHALGLRVVAEGVETADQLQHLKECRCDEIQGYLISRPLPVDEITKYLETLREEAATAPFSAAM
jgi:diguanylate cyclase (GGDEF)-like protein/PAS domain S-box-containing protein